MYKRKYAIVDRRSPKECKDSLKKWVDAVIETYPHPQLYDAVSCHPDMMMCVIDEEIIIAAPDTPTMFLETLKRSNIPYIVGEKKLGARYPHHIVYNAAVVGKYAFHTFQFTDPSLVKILKKKNKTLISVKQGYTKCSTCVLNDEAIITADTTISEAAKGVGLDVLKISPGHIELPGLNYGFIGGASGILEEKVIAFSGSLRKHPEAEMIERFVHKQGMSIQILAQRPIRDLGSIYVVGTYSV